MSDLGDIGKFLKEGSLSDLSWLDVNEEEYHKLDTLPKQNLDIQPDLLALWARDDSSPTNHLVPNTGPVEPFPGAGQPHTMGDLSESYGELRTKPEEIRKIARLSLVQSSDPSRFRDSLVKRFGLAALQENRSVIAAVLQERGLLGKLYIAAEDYPTCSSGSKQASDFVQK